VRQHGTADHCRHHGCAPLLTKLSPAALNNKRSRL
jgi:hypothetical protein